MIKLILSPLFLLVVVLWPTLYFCMRRGKNGQRVFVAISCAALLIVTVLSTGAVSGYLERLLEAGLNDTERCPADAILVLSGGYVPGETMGDDRLNGESVLRVVKGVELLNKCDTKQMILSGSSRGWPPGRDGELMRDFAIRLGVHEERILLENESVNTREHVSRLEKTGWFDRDAELAIISSPWHLRRVMLEFSRIFHNSYPVMAYGRPSKSGSVMPQPGALHSSTTMLHEYIGNVWYKVLDRFQGDSTAAKQR